MKANKLTFVGCLASKFSILCLLMFLGITSAFAQVSDKFYLKAGDLILGQENNISIVLDNGNNEVAALNFKLELPAGVTISATNALVPNKTRLTSAHELALTKQSTNDASKNVYIVSVLPNQIKSIKGTEGAIADLKVNISKTFNIGDGKEPFVVSEVALSSRFGDKVFQDELEGYTFNYVFKPIVGTLSAEQQTIEIYNGEKALVNVALDNRYATRSLQFDMQLPQGLSVEKNAEGDYAFIKGDRMPNHEFSTSDLGNGKLRVFINSFSGWQISGIENSHLFAFNVVADETFDMAGGDIVLDNIIMADDEGNSYANTQVVTVSVKNLSVNTIDNEEAYKRLNEQIKADYQNQLDSIKNLANASLVQRLIDNAQKATDNLSADVQKAFDNKQLKKDSQLNVDLKQKADNALGAVNLELIYADYDAVEMDMLKSSQVATDLGYAEVDKFLALQQQLNSVKRGFGYSPVADFAQVEVVKAAYADLAALVADLNALAESVNGAAFDEALAKSFDGADLIGAAFDAKNFIEEDVAVLEPARAALVEKYAALAAKHNALTDMSTLEALNKELEAFRGQMAQFIAVPGFVFNNPMTGMISLMDAQVLTNYVVNGNWPTDSLEMKRLLKRGDIDGQNGISLFDAQLIINQVLNGSSK